MQTHRLIFMKYAVRSMPGSYKEDQLPVGQRGSEPESRRTSTESVEICSCKKGEAGS
jgi:hypothetical protein